jgi:hypothetical protein
MAITTDVIVSFDVNDLQEVSILDASTMSDSSTISDINGIRMLFSTVNSVSGAAEASECTAWYEYEVLTGTATANGISYTVGDLMLFANDTTPTGTYTMQLTGRYGQYVSDVLPKEGQLYAFTPTETGREAVNTLYFQDEVFSLDYEQYETIYNVGDSLVAGTYLAVGDSDGYAVIDGTKTIYTGEVFVATGGESFGSEIGNVILVEFAQSGQFSFATQYESFIVYQSYLSAKAIAVSPSSILDSNLLAVASLYASPTIAAQTTEGIDLTGLQINLDRINAYYSQQLT